MERRCAGPPQRSKAGLRPHSVSGIAQSCVAACLAAAKWLLPCACGLKMCLPLCLQPMRRRCRQHTVLCTQLRRLHLFCVPCCLRCNAAECEALGNRRSPYARDWPNINPMGSYLKINCRWLLKIPQNFGAVQGGIAASLRRATFPMCSSVAVGRTSTHRHVGCAAGGRWSWTPATPGWRPTRPPSPLPTT